MAETDIESVQEIEIMCYGSTLSAGTYRHELSNPSHYRYLVARLFQQAESQAPAPPTHSLVVGSAGLWIGFDEAHVITIAVAPSYRRRRIGELLLNGLIDCAREWQAVSLTLEVRVSNMAAQRLYQKYGFEVVGKRPRYYTDNGEDAIIMTTAPPQSRRFQERIAHLRANLLRTSARTCPTARGDGS